MMRRLFLLLILVFGLALGLALALAVNGRMAHLRALVDALPGAGVLPGWSAAIDDSAGIIRGQVRLGAGEITWRLQGVGLEGPVWRFHLDGQGLSLEASAVLAWPGVGERGPVLAVAPVTGRFDSAAAGAGLTGWPEALIEPIRGGFRLDLRGEGLTALQIEGLARDVVFEGSALGTGRFTLSHEAGEEWRLVATLRDAGADDSGALHAELRIDPASGTAVLALVPQEPGQMAGDMPPEGVLRALVLPPQLAAPTPPDSGG
ncbi:MAG: hypothetical protein JJT95_04040 [Pararhodobacter sp.]|nr:hypothetical protein [Pararhodobacter sp.]